MSDRKQITGDSIANLLASWRLWVAGALAGGLLAAGLYTAAPADYRAQATVSVDMNLEEAWTYYPDRQLFQFARRETARLAEVAWSDAVLAAVAEATGLSVADLRDGALQLSQPGDGGWHFYAVAAEAAQAEALATAWAETFVRAVRDAVMLSPQLEAARAELNGLAATGVAAEDETVAALMAEITQLYEQSEGISPYVEASVVQAAELPRTRSVSIATYALVGSIVGAAAGALAALWRARDAGWCL